MRKFPVLLTLLLLPVFSLHSTEEVIWSEDFRNGTGSAKPYREIETVEALEKNGEAFLRVSLPGQQTLEGVRIPMGMVEGGRLMTVTAKVRGSGTLGAMVQAANGWTRLPQISLTGEWQDVRIPRTLKAGANQPIVHFVSLPLDVIQSGAVFEIADLQATLAPPLVLADREVKPRRFEVEEYASNTQNIRGEDDATCVVVRGSFASEEIPFPQTRRPVSVYVRYRPASPRDRILLRTHRGGHKQELRERNPAAAGWQWLEFSGLGAEEAGEGIVIEAWPDKEANLPAAVDALIFSTSSLDETALNSAQ